MNDSDLDQFRKDVGHLVNKLQNGSGLPLEKVWEYVVEEWYGDGSERSRRISLSSQYRGFVTPGPGSRLDMEWRSRSDIGVNRVSEVDRWCADTEVAKQPSKERVEGLLRRMEELQKALDAEYVGQKKRKENTGPSTNGDGLSL